MPECLLGLGSNLGDRARQLDLAVQRIAAHADLEVAAVSRYHSTAPIGGPTGQGEFLNAALRLQTSLSPETLLDHLMQVESGLQRERPQRWAARTIDLDILLYGQTCLQLPHLVLPHPRMAFRRFVLEPAAEIAAEMVHPELGWTVRSLLRHLNEAAPYVAVTGLPKAGKTALAEAVAVRCAVQLVTDPQVSSRQQGGTASSVDVASHWDRLESRYGLLRCTCAAHESHPSISDFWFDQARAYAECLLSQAEWARYRVRHEEKRQSILLPKLLVLLEMDPQQSVTRMRTSGSVDEAWDVERVTLIARRLNDLALRPQQQPVLRLHAEPLPEAVEEVAAAIETMR